jgi:hypothetical protein
VAAHARRTLLSLIALQKELPEHSFRVFLHCIELENYLTKLEKCDFNIFDSNLQKQNTFKIWYNMMRAAQSKEFLRILKIN